jgi:hypothetical protein
MRKGVDCLRDIIVLGATYRNCFLRDLEKFPGKISIFVYPIIEGNAALKEVEVSQEKMQR